MTLHPIETYLALLLIACAVAMGAKQLQIPYTIALVIAGLVLAFLNLAPGVVISREVPFTFILPPLLFYGALELDLEDLKKNWVPIAALAIPGVIVSTLLIGWLVHWWWGISLITGLLF